jgi:hypothetical protein
VEEGRTTWAKKIAFSFAAGTDEREMVRHVVLAADPI